MKRHFEILDGLRGTASLLVVVYHLLEGIFSYTDNPLRHAYLAVDFFFLLSGFVVGYAYDERWPGLRVRDFLRGRLIRLHPLVLLAVVLGALGYWFDPYVGSAQLVSGWRMSISVALGSLLLPSPRMPNRFDVTHPLNQPCWSLLQEYLANIAYALAAPRLKRKALIVVVALAALVLMAAALRYKHLQGGWDFHSFWMAPVRVAFPFGAGLLLYRVGLRLRLPSAYPLLSLLLLLLFAAPAFQPASYYEAFCVIGLFPLLVAAGAGAYTAGRLGPLCRLTGRLSYPLYLIHYPFVVIFNHWVAATHPSRERTLLSMAGLVLFLLVMAWAALRFYDEPVRAWLSARARRKQTAPQLQRV
jgi:peptidoglycan/LPS O-acetylase OafA/YrhL